MIRTILLIGLILAFIVGGLLVLRRSARTGMPDPEVLARAQERARKQNAADDAGR